MKKYIIFAGVNGAGKSTLFQTLKKYSGMNRVNSDEIVKEFGSWKNPSDVSKAGRIAVSRINNLKYRIIALTKRKRKSKLT